MQGIRYKNILYSTTTSGSTSNTDEFIIYTKKMTEKIQIQLSIDTLCHEECETETDKLPSVLCYRR